MFRETGRSPPPGRYPIAQLDLPFNRWPEAGHAGEAS